MFSIIEIQCRNHTNLNLLSFSVVQDDDPYALKRRINEYMNK